MLNAQQADSLSVAAAAPSEEEEVNVSELVFGHIGDAYEWHIATLGGKEWSIPLPVIVHSSTGWHVFSSSHLKEGNMKDCILLLKARTKVRLWNAMQLARKCVRLIFPLRKMYWDCSSTVRSCY